MENIISDTNQQFAELYNLPNKTNISNLYRDIIVLYCPEKVGSSSIVSSIRLYASDKFMVFHTHEEKIADIFNIATSHIRISDILLNNNIINPQTGQPRQIYFIDIFRTPIERKISSFFQKISEIHFNNSEPNISSYPIDKIIKRFNDIFPYFEENDYFNNYYPCEKIKQFDFDKKYIHIVNSNIHFIKLRLQDSEHWSNIISDILKTKIQIINNYDTIGKDIGKKYNEFKNNYKLPYNFYELIKNENNLNIYLTENEKNEYLQKWFCKICPEHKSFTPNEYAIYKLISEENKFYCANTSNKHYSDDGCLCSNCITQRQSIINNIDSINSKDIYIRHKYDENYDNNIFIKLFPYKDKTKSIDLIINLINL